MAYGLCKTYWGMSAKFHSYGSRSCKCTQWGFAYSVACECSQHHTTSRIVNTCQLMNEGTFRSLHNAEGDTVNWLETAMTDGTREMKEWMTDLWIHSTWCYCKLHCWSIRCTIDWKKGKNVTVKVVKKVQKHKGRGTKRTVMKTVQNDSFFNFFAPPQGE